MTKPSLPASLTGFAAFLGLGWIANRAGHFGSFVFWASIAVALGILIVAAYLIRNTTLDLTGSDWVQAHNAGVLADREAKAAKTLELATEGN
jgi:hypothetical protein